MDALNRPLAKGYDYIVVGGGSGGCPVVRRLIENTGATVLLIEAGEAGLDVLEINDPTAWVPLGRSRFDWGHTYAPTPHVNNRAIGIPRGKVLGGSSAINALMWYRGNPLDYDGWAEGAATGWDFQSVLPYFRRAEDWQMGETPLRGTGGPLKISISKGLHPVAEALMDGADELGIAKIDDPNGETNEGGAYSNFNIWKGKRWSSANGYLAPILGHPNLTILTGSLAVGLVFQGGKCAAVRHLVDGTVVETSAQCEVILALGAIETPRLLMLSGVGDPQELSRIGVKTHTALPGVGQNLQDHPLVQACVFKSKNPLGPAMDNGGGTMLNWQSRPDLLKPDVHAFPVQGNSAEPEIRQRYDTSGTVFSIGFGLMDSRSVGYIKLHGNGPTDPLEIQPNFLAEKADLEALLSAFDTIMNLGGTRAFEAVFDGYAAPDRKLDREAAIEFIRNGCSTFFHTCGTCKMGTDEMAVVDPKLRVRGIEGLRISDASVIPTIPTCNTHAPVTMIGERAADFLREAA